MCITFEYPWLPPKCGICGKWGHFADGCLANLGKAQQGIQREQVTPVESGLGKTMQSSIPVDQSDSLKLVKTKQSELAESGDNTAGANDLNEVEEGEIQPPLPSETEHILQGDWTEVTSSGGRKSLSVGKGLVYGHVSIASPTRYDALQDKEEDSEGAESSENIFGVLSAEAELDLDESQKHKHVSNGVTLRVPPPRHSKNQHKFIFDSNQKAKANTPSGIGKKNTRKNL